MVGLLLNGLGTIKHRPDGDVIELILGRHG